MRSGWIVSVVCSAGLMQGAGFARADRFTIVEPNGKTEVVEARLIGSNSRVHALELADGQIRLVPQVYVRKRVPSEGPVPLKCEAVLAQLKKKFSAENFRGICQKPYVIGLVPATPLERSDEKRARALLLKAGRFLRNVESVFSRFGSRMKFPLQEPRFPLVMLIFETDADFEKYTVQTTGNRGLSAGNIAGFYSSLTNWLAIRLSECSTFEVPLHEAIHQQVYNRGVFQRLAPVPVWFNEGIATGFEGNGDRIRSSPMKINSRYARLSLKQSRIDWETVILDDKAFRGDVLAGDAYTHAWGLHWLLATRYEKLYPRYVRLLGQKRALETVRPEKRKEEFEAVFGKPLAEIQADFSRALTRGMKRQKIPPEEPKQAGVSLTESHLGEARVFAVQRRGVLQVRGQLKNLSPLRPMDFYVILVTGSGEYAEWYLPRVGLRKTVVLKNQIVRNVLPGAPGGPAATFRVLIRSAVPGTAESQRWSRGEFPRSRVQ